MRFLALILLLTWMPANAEAKPDDPTPSTLATWIRSGTDAELRDAADAAAAMSSEALLRVFRAVRDWTRIDSALGDQKIALLSWKKKRLADAIEHLRDMTALNFFISPAARKVPDVRITIKLKNATVKTVLDLMTEPHGLGWVIRDGVVRIDTAQALTPRPAAPSPADIQMQQKLHATTVALKLPRCDWDEAIREIRKQTGYVVVLDSRIAEQLRERHTVHETNVRDRFNKILDHLCIFAGVDLGAWYVLGGKIVITHKEYLPK